MPKFFASTSKGLAEALEKELSNLAIKVNKKTSAGVWFEGNWRDCYRANLALRTATRVLLPVLDFHAYKADDVYHNTRRHDFTKYLKPNQTFAIDSSGQSEIFRDRRLVALKVKDAIADQFRDRFGRRPDVDRERPDVWIHVRLKENEVSLAVDTSGSSLSQRGYRRDQGMAPLREHLAAGILELIDWQGDVPLVDLMCGSGTFLIEAALKASGQAPGLSRQRFGFQNFSGYDEEQFQQIRAELKSNQKKCAVVLAGSDRDARVVQAAKENARRAGCMDMIEFGVIDFSEAGPPSQCPPGVVLVNPPYGERIGDLVEAQKTLRRLSETLKSRFKGWTCWILSGNEEAIRGLGLKASRRIPLFNGNIECRLLKYEIH